jgi:hypothetical protein
MDREAAEVGAVVVTVGSAIEGGGGGRDTSSRSHDSVRGHGMGSLIGIEATTRTVVRQT